MNSQLSLQGLNILVRNSDGNQGSAVLVLVPFLRNKMEGNIKGPPPLIARIARPSLIPRPYILILLE